MLFFIVSNANEKRGVEGSRGRIGGPVGGKKRNNQKGVRLERRQQWAQQMRRRQTTIKKNSHLTIHLATSTAFLKRGGVIHSTKIMVLWGLGKLKKEMGEKIQWK